ncbi:hypothetical protein GK047_08850 [Paenibacillus sp. SYP-B3998]|uniref:Uncharacterized protein n=1 Tax=Paenibacillus sp. SYP-B3998 TaxID=2678564 RepID=A0A6G3ZV68_9BACL|nr:hypothetical protein [Paenibacillus sp. SYP-B3998]NEW06116.1 hypothetical protein [Paenibacillus sp. SYP-B3998]
MHDEDTSLQGYFGKSLSDRLQYMGYSRASGEDVAYNSGSLVELLMIYSMRPTIDHHS